MFFYDSKIQFSPNIKESVESNPQDRRYLPRWDAANRVIYRKKQDESIHECQSKDINCSGAAIWTEEEIPTQEKINLTVFLSKDVFFSVDATVLWKKKRDDQTLVGVRFDAVAEEIRDLIFNYAFEYNKAKYKH